MFICLMSISSVCAHENMTDETDIISTDNTANEEISAPETGNFTELSELIRTGGGTIELTKDYKYVEGDNVPVTGIRLTREYQTIEGNGHTIDGSNLVRIFNLDGYTETTLKNLRLINGYSSGKGGAINAKPGALIADNCIFENNHAENQGGAIYTGEYAVIRNSNFTGNSAHYRGGAIFSDERLYIENSVFSNNYNDFYDEYLEINLPSGGAVYVNNYASRITTSTFINNTSHDGGAVYLGEGTLSDSKFINNTAFYGGGLFWEDADKDLNNLSFENNTAVYNGGGILGKVHGRTVNNATFINNTASVGGGISLSDSYAISDESNSQNAITNSKFINNTALYGGAGADVVSHTKISNSTFISNNANNYGGGVSSSCSELVNLTFTDNTAIFGGAVYTYSSTIEDSEFRGNDAPNGKAIYILDESTLINNKNLDESDIDTFDSGQERGEETSNPYGIENLMGVTGGYLAYCAERYTDGPCYGVFDNSMALLRNKITHQPVGEYLKIAIYTYVNGIQDLIDHSFNNTVWAFTDFEFWDSDDPIVQETVRLYDSGFRVPTENALKILPNGTSMYFNFSSLLSPAAQQNLFIFKFEYRDDFDGTLTKETLNKSAYVNDNVEFRIVVSNNGETSMSNIFIEDNDYSYGLKYVGWKPEIGNWIYNETSKRWTLDELGPAESASIILTFNAFVNGTLINNATGGIDNIALFNASNSTNISYKKYSVEKIALNKTVEIGNATIFEIIVKNLGDTELNGITIVEDKYDDGLVYLRFKSVQGAWVESLNNASKHVFKLDSPLQAGETASFQVIFNTTKIGEFKNTVVGTYENGYEINSTNITNVINSTSPDDPDNETTPDTPEDRTTPDTPENNPSDEISKNEKSDYKITKVDDKATGNPLLALILALLILPIRKYKN